MTRKTSTNFTGAHAFTLADAITDAFARTDVQQLAAAVDSHTHATGNGLGIDGSTLPTADPFVLGALWNNNGAVYVSGGPGTPPNTISGLVAWYDAQSISGLSNNAAVASWPDKSATANNLIQNTTAARPVYLSSSINAHPAVSFNGSSQYLSMAAAFNAGDNNTLFIAFQPASSAPVGLFDSAPGQINTYRNGQAGTWEIWNLAPSIALSLPNANPVSIALTATISGQRQVVYERNGLLISTNTNPSTTSIAWTTPNVGNINTGSPWYSGTIGEFIIYNRALSSAERAGIAQYLHARWGI
jgi:hypothetical protein